MEVSLLLMEQIAQLFIVLLMGYMWSRPNC